MGDRKTMTFGQKAAAQLWGQEQLRAVPAGCVGCRYLSRLGYPLDDHHRHVCIDWCPQGYVPGRPLRDT